MTWDRPAVRWSVSAFVAAAVAAFHLLFSDPDRGPRIMADEAGYLANAIFLANGDVVTMKGTAFYAGGYSVLLVPFAAWFGDDRLGLYRSTIVMQSALAALVVLVVAWIVRQLLEVSHPVALLAGALAGLTPAYVMHSGLSWAEAILTVCSVVAFALVLRLLRSASDTSLARQLLAHAVPAGLALGALAAVHRRMLVPALVVLVVLSLWAVVERRPWPLVATFVAFGVVVIAGGALDSYLEHHVWAGEAVDLQMSSKAAGLRTWDGASTTLAAAVGQAWYLLVASVGLAGIAVAACLERVRLPSRLDWRGWFCLTVLGSLGSLVAVSAVFVGSATHQAEYLIYGRYPEVLAPLLVGIGVAWTTTATPRRLVAAAAGTIVATLAAWFVVAELNADWLARTMNRVVVPGVIDWVLADSAMPPLLRGTIVAIAVTVVIVAARLLPTLRSRPSWRTAIAATVVLSAWSWQLVAIREHVIVPLRTNADGLLRLVEPVRATGAGNLGIDPALGGGARVGLSLRLPGVVVEQDDGTSCLVLVPSSGASDRGEIVEDLDTVTLIERPPPCRT